jgi:hypothetical protein
MALALQQASAMGIGWLLHADPDELLHVGHPSGSLAAQLAALPCHVAAVRILNFEGQPEAGDVANRYEQVSGAGKHAAVPRCCLTDVLLTAVVASNDGGPSTWPATAAQTRRMVS